MPRPDDLTLLDPAAPRHVTLPEQLQRRRVVVVGDVHGCCDELRALLRAHGRAGDVVILAGDLVNKGPKSPEVLRLARELGCLAVVCNHELAVLRGRAARQVDPSAEPSYAWTDALSEEDVQYVRSLPFTISLPLHRALVVHAGLVPGVPLEEQQLLDMVAMRNLSPKGDEKGGWTAHETDVPGGEAWAGVWPGPEHVYFGHDAKRRLQQRPRATGLDTGCLYGGQLTAAVLQLGQPPHLVSVPARAVYVQPGSKRPATAPRGSPAVLCLAVGAGLAAALAVGWRQLQGRRPGQTCHCR